MPPDLPAYFTVTDLNLPLPPGPPREWTSLLHVFGVDALWQEGTFHEGLLRDLLVAAGRPLRGDESRFLLWTTPILAGPSSTQRLVQLLGLNPPIAAIQLLGHSGDPKVIPPLQALLAAPRPDLHGPTWIALARLGTKGTGLYNWRNDTCEEQFLARTLLKDRPEEVPASFPSPLVDWLDNPTPTTTDALFLIVEELSPALREGVAVLLSTHPASLHPRHVPQICRWSTRGARWWPSLQSDDPALNDALLDSLAHPDWETRMGAALLLGTLPVLPDGAALALERALADDDTDVQREAALSLHRHDPSIPLSAPTIRYGYPRRAGQRAQGLLGPPVDSALLSLFLSSQHEPTTATLLFSLALDRPTLYAPLFDAICLDRARDQPILLRRAAAAALLLSGVAPTALPELQRILLTVTDDLSTPVKPERASAYLAIAARDADWEVRLAALLLLGRTPLSPESSRDLLQILATTDSEPAVRRAAQALLPIAYLHPSPGHLLAKALLRDPANDAGRAQALSAYVQHDPEGGLPLANALLDTHDRQLALAASALVGGQIPPESRDLRVQSGLERLRHDDWVQREVGASLLGHLDLGTDLSEELAEILEVLSTDDPDDDVRSMARWAAARLRRTR